MDIRLTDVEARVLGALVEKEITTPEYYPLSLNALVNACNQKSNREPVMNLSEEDVTLAMRRLGELELAGAADTTDSRVRKYEHRLQEVFNFTRPETAVLCVLLLRGAQTPGELRGRAERMYKFDDLSDVQGALQKLMGREPPLARVLPRAAGTKESRYLELLSGDPGASGAEVAQVVERGHTAEHAPVAAGGSDRERMARLESEVAALREEVAELKLEFARFRKQFE
ncbi:MAG: YceH family protein [Candidatus Acidiferrales bacterium]